MTETFTWRAEVSTSGSGEFSMLTAKFGDSYSQEVPNGINNELQRWTVSVSGYPEHVQPALDFIRAHKGQSFIWKAPRSTAPGYYKCKKYSLGDQGGAWWTFTFEFEQAFAP